MPARKKRLHISFHTSHARSHRTAACNRLGVPYRLVAHRALTWIKGQAAPIERNPEHLCVPGEEFCFTAPTALD
jgi:hypothetical protein